MADTPAIDKVFTERHGMTLAEYVDQMEDTDMVDTNTQIRQLAEDYRARFTMIERGEETIWTRRDTNDEIALDLIVVTHDDRDMAPDDYRYEYTVDALDMILDATDDADLEELGYELEADVNYHELNTWLASRVDSYAWVDEARDTFGTDAFESITDEISAGQQAEKQHVYNLVLQFLTDKAEEAV